MVELEVLAIEDEGWRVRIAAAGADNPFGLLGFITASRGRYEVFQLGMPPRRTARGSFEEALDVLRQEPADVDAILAGSNSWSHTR